MKGEENLIPMSERSKEEVRELGRKGGIASGETRKKKKLFKEQIELLLSLPLKDKKTIKQLESLGVDADNIDNQMAMVISMWMKALKGDVNAFNTLRDTAGEKPQENINLSGNVNNPYENLTEDELRKLANGE